MKKVICLKVTGGKIVVEMQNSTNIEKMQEKSQKLLNEGAKWYKNYFANGLRRKSKEWNDGIAINDDSGKMVRDENEEIAGNNILGLYEANDRVVENERDSYSETSINNK